jgi:UDP-N-acetylmuramate--alanine ligase
MRERLRACLGSVPARLCIVSIAGQRLSLVNNQSVAAVFPVSTSRFGAGNREGSFMTPPGIHRVTHKIGDGAPPGRIFRDREDTGEDWRGEERDENLILTRIIRLEGCEDGVNRGPGIDSFERFIYLHGTNRESGIGTPLSHGCVCMRNDDIISLYSMIEVGTIVVID